MSTLVAVSGTAVAGFFALFGLSIVSTETLPLNGLYTVKQADLGHALYEKQCLSCHGSLSAITPEVAALLGDHTFRNKWRGRPIGELFALILETMPQDSPGTLSLQQTAGLVAYILSGHRIPAGDVALAEDIEKLNRIPFDP